MANGDITHVKVQGRFTLPGTGSSLTGTSKNNKEIVWGELSATWADTTGLDLNESGGPKAFGLETLDFVSFNVKSVNGVFNIDEGIWTAEYNTSTQKVYVVLDGLTNPTSEGHVCVMGFLAIGDSASTASLT